MPVAAATVYSGTAGTSRLVPVPTDGSREQIALKSNEAARVAAAVRALPTRQREVVVARYFLGLTAARDICPMAARRTQPPAQSTSPSASSQARDTRD